MQRPMRFDEFCAAANLVLAHTKKAGTSPTEGGALGLLGSLQNLPAPALGALLGGGAGLVTGAFSDKPGSMLRHGLAGAGLGALGGWGGSKLMEYLAQQQGQGQGGLPQGMDAQTAADAKLTPKEIVGAQPQPAQVPSWDGVQDAAPDWLKGDPATAGWQGKAAPTGPITF